MDQAIKEKANKNTQTPSGTIVQLQWYATLLLQTTDDFFFFDTWRNGNILQHR